MPAWAAPEPTYLPLVTACDQLTQDVVGATWVALCLAQGHGIGDPWPEASILMIFCAVLVPVAAWSFRAAVDRARRDGTVTHY